MFTFHRQTSCPISSLPNELLHEIVSYLPVRSDSKGFVSDNRDVAAFSMVSRRMRAIALPFLFHDVVITSHSQLESLSQVIRDLLSQIHELNIFMKAEFVDAWKSRSPSRALVHILSQTPSLRALRILMAELTGPSSGWSRFSLGRTRSLPVGYAMNHALLSLPHFTLPEMKILEVDALEDIEPLAAIVPNLEILRMNVSSGYDIYANGRLINALKHLPRLRELGYSPESLRMSEMSEIHPDDEVETVQEVMEMNDGSAEFIHAVAQVVPFLEKLDLQTRWYGEDIRFSEPSEPISSHVLKEELTTLSELESITLPSSVSSPNDHKVFITPSPDRASLSTALFNATTAERALAVELGSDNSHLKSISFVRPVSHVVDPQCRPNQFSVTYTIDSTPKRVIFAGYNLPTIIHPATTEVDENVHIQSADDGQVDTCPKTIMNSSFERMIGRFTREQRMNTMAVVIFAGTTAMAVSEVGKLLGV